MPTQYPYKSDRLCLVCGEPIYINWPSHQGKKLCSEKCRIQFIKLKMKVEKKEKNCPSCNKLFKPKRDAQNYCSLKCRKPASVVYDRICRHCGKHFQVNNISQIKRGDHIYCSSECSRKKYNFKQLDFKEQNPENMYWLGFMFASIIDIGEQFLEFESTRYMINEFQKFINGNLPITQKGDLYRISLYSRVYVQHMRTVGLRTDFYQEAPIIQSEYVKDFIRGYFDGNKGYIYKEKDKNVVAIHGYDSKLMRYIADMLNSILTYKEKEWIVVCFDFEISCNGLPKNRPKWNKFQIIQKNDS